MTFRSLRLCTIAKQIFKLRFRARFAQDSAQTATGHAYPQYQGSRRLPHLKVLAPSEFASLSFKRSTELAPYSVLVYLDVCLKLGKVGVLIPSLESEHTHDFLFLRFSITTCCLHCFSTCFLHTVKFVSIAPEQPINVACIIVESEKFTILYTGPKIWNSLPV